MILLSAKSTIYICIRLVFNHSFMFTIRLASIARRFTCKWHIVRCAYDSLVHQAWPLANLQWNVIRCWSQVLHESHFWGASRTAPLQIYNLSVFSKSNLPLCYNKWVKVWQWDDRHEVLFVAWGGGSVKCLLHNKWK